MRLSAHHIGGYIVSVAYNVDPDSGGRGRGPKGEFNGKGDFHGRGEGQKGDAPRENFRGGQGRTGRV